MTTEEKWEKIEGTLDEMGVRYDIGTDEGLIEFWTNTSGQDVSTEFHYDGTPEDYVSQFVERAEKYDVDEEVEIFVDMRGRGGVPSSVRELLDDCQEAKDKLMKIAKELQKALMEVANNITEETKVFMVRIEVYDGCKIGDIETAVEDGLTGIHCDSSYEVTETTE